MDRSNAGWEVWRELEYDSTWALFDERFQFKPDFYERTIPAIRLAGDCLVLDLAPVFSDNGPRFAAAQAAVNAAALRAFVLLTDDELVALDWQHSAYRYSPAAHALSSAKLLIPVFPNGDYYIHMSPDLRWGTFGHPWQESLCIWGHDLVETLGAELSTWLPKHSHSVV